MNCPKCGKKMEQEGQSEHFIRDMGKQYNSDTKEWYIPNYIDIGFIRSFWCRNDGCSMKNKYTYHDEPHKYTLNKKIVDELNKVLEIK